MSSQEDQDLVGVSDFSRQKSAFNCHINSITAFVAYPEAVTRLPVSPLWSFLFFTMLITLGLDSQFTGVETLITAMMDEWPLLRKRKGAVVLGMCALFFILGLPLCANGGVLMFTLIDWFCSSWSLLLIAIIEVVFVTYAYGHVNLFANISEMGIRDGCYDGVFGCSLNVSLKKQQVPSSLSEPSFNQKDPDRAAVLLAAELAAPDAAHPPLHHRRHVGEVHAGRVQRLRVPGAVPGHGVADGLAQRGHRDRWRRVGVRAAEEERPAHGRQSDANAGGGVGSGGGRAGRRSECRLPEEGGGGLPQRRLQ